jgi:hypothetical protein
VFRTSSGELIGEGTQTNPSTVDIVIPNIGYNANEYITVRVRYASPYPTPPGTTKYLPFETQAILSSSGSTVYVSQVVDGINT